MVTFVFENDSKEKALKFRDQMHEHLKGIPAYIDNQVILTSGTPKYEDGEMEVEYDGHVGKHCIMVTISDPNSKDTKDLINFFHIVDNHD